MVNVLGGRVLESLLTEAAPAQNLNPPEEAPTQGKEPMPPMPGTLSIATLSKYKEDHTAWRGGGGTMVLVFFLNRSYN